MDYGVSGENSLENSEIVPEDKYLSHCEAICALLKRIVLGTTNERRLLTDQSLLSRDYVHHVVLNEV